MRVNGQDVDHTIELRDIYDGWSVAILADGTVVNRWGTGEGDELRAMPGYERRFEITQAYIAENAKHFARFRAAADE